MDAFRLIYKILKFLEASLHVEEFPLEQFKCENFKVSEQYFKEILKMLCDDGYVKGITFVQVLGQTTPGLKYIKPEITIKGLEYLEENSMMKKAADIAKGIIEIIK